MAELSQAAREARNAYMREYSKNKRDSKYHKEWRKANPEKIKEYNRRYWEKKAAKEAEQC